jgi:hypothetical protein
LPAITCDVFVVGGFVLTAVGQQAPTPVSLTSNHVFWTGIAFACLLLLFLPDWARVILFVVALFASDLIPIITGHARLTTTDVLMLFTLVIGLLVGLYFGRIRGLRHLGEYEFRNRWGYIRSISRWF